MSSFDTLFSEVVWRVTKGSSANDMMFLSAQHTKIGVWVDGIDQDQTAQNVRSDLTYIPSACLVNQDDEKGSVYQCNVLSAVKKDRTSSLTINYLGDEKLTISVSANALNALNKVRKVLMGICSDLLLLCRCFAFLIKLKEIIKDYRIHRTLV